MAHLVIADAGPLIGLAPIQHLQRLEELFATVTISATVAQDLGWARGAGARS